MDEEEKSSERKRLLKKLARIRKEKKIALQTLSERSDEYSSNNETWTCRRCTLVNEKERKHINHHESQESLGSVNWDNHVRLVVNYFINTVIRDKAFIRSAIKAPQFVGIKSDIFI